VLKVHNIYKSYGLNPVLRKIIFSLNHGERAALVGPNGCGKSTLLDILARRKSPDSGHAAYTPSTLRIGYLQQGMTLDRQEAIGAYLNRFASNLEETLDSLKDICDALVLQPEDPGLVSRYSETLKALDRAQQIEGLRLDVLSRFKLHDIPRDTPIALLSGGQKMRLALAGLLLDRPDMLLLDEPTNHLDLEMRIWLRDWVQSFPGAILLVSHDRAFLDAVIHKVIAFSPTGEGVREYPGNYTHYLEVRESEFDMAMQAYVDQQDEIKRLKKAARSVRDKARPHKGGKADAKNTDGFSVGHFSDRSLETVKRAKQIEKRVAFLEDEGALEKPSQAWDVRMQFSDISRSGDVVLQMDRLSIGYDGQPLMPPITQTITQGQRIALLGPNGVGKTTLFKTLLGKTEPVSGGYKFGKGVHPGYLSQEQEMLDPDLTVLKTIQEIPGWFNQTQARTFLHRFLFSGDEVFQPVETLSYGQRSRLMLAMLVADQCNFLLLDEPLNHLDLSSQESFEAALSCFEGTIIAITHDQYFIDRFAHTIWWFTPEDLRVELTSEALEKIRLV